MLIKLSDAVGRAEGTVATFLMKVMMVLLYLTKHKEDREKEVEK